MKNMILSTAALLLLALVASAQYSIDWYKVAGGAAPAPTALIK